MSEINRQDRLADTEINAYIDGELDLQGLSEVEAWLADHPEDAARVHAYKLQKLNFHQLYDLPKDAPLPQGVREALAANSMRRWLPGWRQLAAGVMLLVVGSLGGWYGGKMTDVPQRATAAGFVQRALNNYAVFAYDSARPVEIGTNDDGDFLNWLSDRVGRQLRTPDLATAGFTLIGGRLVSDQGAPAALFMYEDDKSQRVTLYVRQAAGTVGTKFQRNTVHQMTALYWSDKTLDYAISGEIPLQELRRLAEMINHEIEAKAST